MTLHSPKLFFFYCFLLTTQIGLSQAIGLEELIQKALAHNHNILISKTQTNIQKNNQHIGNAGLLPKLALNGNLSISKSIANIEFATEQGLLEDVASESKTQRLNAEMTYTLFNGFGNIRMYKKLKSQYTIAQIQEKLSIESTLIQVINQYYLLLKFQAQEHTYQRTLAISKDRLIRAEKKENYGAIGKINVLNAQVDFNRDSSNLLASTQQLIQAKNTLNFLIGNPITSPIEASVSLIDYNTIESLEKIDAKAQQNNANILLSNTNLSMSALDKKISTARISPIFNASIGYGYNASESNPSVVLRNNSLGFTGSLNLLWNLFDGNKARNALKNAALILDKNTVQQEQTKLRITKEVHDYYGLYKQHQASFLLESTNLTVTELNLKRSEELFKRGQINNVQFRQAQLALSKARLIKDNAAYNTALYYFQLKRLMGDLLIQ